MKRFTIPVDTAAIDRARGLTPTRKARPSAGRPRTLAYLIVADAVPITRVHQRGEAVQLAERLALDWSPPVGTLAFGRPARVQVLKGRTVVASFVCK